MKAAAGSALLTLALMSGVAVVGAGLVFFATCKGIGLSPDPVVYVAMARRFLDRPEVWHKAREAARFPPLYPAVLALFGASSDPLAAARWVNVALFGLNIALAGLFVWRASGGSAARGVTAAVLMLDSIAMITVHTQAWSEPLFLFLVLGGVGLLARHLEGTWRPAFFLAAGVVALAFLTRYVGAALIVSGGVAVLLLGRGGRPRRVAEAAAFVTLAAAPEVAWSLRESPHAVLGIGGVREPAFHLVGLPNVRQGLDTLASWIVPWRTVGWRDGVLACVAVGSTLVLAWRASSERDDHGNGPAPSKLPPVLGLFALAYVLVLGASISTLVADTPLDDRILSPLYAAAVIALTALTGPARSGRPWVRRFRGAAAGLGLSVAAANAIAVIPYVFHAHAEGIGYAGRAYVGSPLLGYLRSLPADVVIVTNAPHVVYIHTGRDAHSLPARYNPSTLRVNDEFDRQVRRIGKEAEARRVVLACFERRKQPYLPTCEELSTKLRLTPLRRFARDGVAYAVRRRASINAGGARAADAPLTA